jgi:hypothetical protein
VPNEGLGGLSYLTAGAVLVCFHPTSRAAHLTFVASMPCLRPAVAPLPRFAMHSDRIFTSMHLTLLVLSPSTTCQ